MLVHLNNSGPDSRAVRCATDYSAGICPRYQSATSSSTIVQQFERASMDCGIRLAESPDVPCLGFGLLSRRFDFVYCESGCGKSNMER